eukprot:355471-Chlamydomonas_euryale.AAC.3
MDKRVDDCAYPSTVSFRVCSVSSCFNEHSGQSKSSPAASTWVCLALPMTSGHWVVQLGDEVKCRCKEAAGDRPWALCMLELGAIEAASGRHTRHRPYFARGPHALRRLARSLANAAGARRVRAAVQNPPTQQSEGDAEASAHPRNHLVSREPSADIRGGYLHR